jgi:hypothetical protein
MQSNNWRAIAVATLLVPVALAQTLGLDWLQWNHIVGMVLFGIGVGTIPTRPIRTLTIGELCSALPMMACGVWFVLVPLIGEIFLAVVVIGWALKTLTVPRALAADASRPS